MQQGVLKKETGGLILAAQDQAFRTNAIKARIGGSQTDSVCRVCKKVDETVKHLVSECGKLAQKEYKRRRDKVALAHCIGIYVERVVLNVAVSGMSMYQR